jgi:hypothetical protein
MPVIKANYAINSSLASNKFYTHPVANINSNKKYEVVSELYLGPGYTNVPGVSNLYFASIEFSKSFRASLEAIKIGDKEGMLEYGLRMTGSPFNLLNAGMQSVSYVANAGMRIKALSTPSASVLTFLATKITAAGLIFSIIEGILETLGLARSVAILKNSYSPDLERIKQALSTETPETRFQKFSECLEYLRKKPLPEEVKAEIEDLFACKENIPQPEFFMRSEELFGKVKENIYLSKLEQIQKKHFSISPKKIRKIDDYVQTQLSHISAKEKLERKERIELTKKKNQLIRRIQNNLTNELEQSISSLTSGLQSSDKKIRLETLKKTAQVFENIHIQAQKRILTHVIGMLAVAITITGLALALLAFPYLIPLLVMTIGSVLSFVRYYLDAGYSETRGWDFNTQNCLPSFLQKKPALSPEPTFEQPTFYFYPKKPKLRYQKRRPNLDFTISVKRSYS